MGRKDFIKYLKNGSTTLPCFYCDVDSTELKIFVFGVIGCLALASIFFFLAALGKGKMKDLEETKFQVFEAENRE